MSNLLLAQYNFEYPKLRSLLIVQIIIGILGAALLITGLRAFYKLAPADEGDKTVFAALGTALCLSGAVLLILVLRYNRKLHRFYQLNEWYGVKTENGKLYCRYFDYFRSYSWETELPAIQKTEPGSYKGRRFFSVYANGKKYNIPLNNLPREQADILFRELQTPVKKATAQQTKPVIRFTEFQLHIVHTMMQLMQKMYAAKFSENIAVLGENHFGFGYNPENPRQPFIEVKISGGGAGDYYSGSVEYDDDFRVRNVFINPQTTVYLHYNHTATNIAGDCSNLYTNYEGDELSRLETDFYAGINSKEKLPPFLAVLARQ